MGMEGGNDDEIGSLGKWKGFDGMDWIGISEKARVGRLYPLGGHMALGQRVVPCVEHIGVDR